MDLLWRTFSDINLFSLTGIMDVDVTNDLVIKAYMKTHVQSVQCRNLYNHFDIKKKKNWRILDHQWKKVGCWRVRDNCIIHGGRDIKEVRNGLVKALSERTKSSFLFLVEQHGEKKNCFQFCFSYYDFFFYVLLTSNMREIQTALCINF